MDSKRVRFVPRVSESPSEAAERYLREDAERLGLEYGDYCRKFGIIGEAATRRQRRHESKLKDET